jgi:hypothetical protein
MNKSFFGSFLKNSKSFFNEFASEESGASDFGTIYMILIFAIAALLLILIVKPIFSNATQTVSKTK